MAVDKLKVMKLKKENSDLTSPLQLLPVTGEKKNGSKVETLLNFL